MDWSKSALADVRHRAIFHSAFGIYIVEKVFGETITNSDDKEVSVRDIAEQHVMEDLGFIPSLEKWLEKLPIEDWMISQSVKGKGVKIEDMPVPAKEDAATKDQVDQNGLTPDQIRKMIEDIQKTNPTPGPIWPNQIPTWPDGPFYPYNPDRTQPEPFMWPVIKD